MKFNANESWRSRLCVTNVAGLRFLTCHEAKYQRTVSTTTETAA